MTVIPQLDVPDILVDDDDEQQAAQPHMTPDAPPQPTVKRSSDLLGTSDASRAQHKSWTPSVDLTTRDSTGVHPLSLPRATPSMPGHHHQARSSQGFDLQEPGSSTSARRTSARPGQVGGLLDDSVWVDSLRRSATVRKSMSKPDRNRYR
jgi:hypothetical protein